MQVGLMVIPHHTKKWVIPLVLFGFKTQQQPYGPTKRKKRKMLNHHHSIGRTKTYDYNVTRKNKKITTRKKLATNNKVLVRSGSLRFFKNYQQPIIKFWWVPAVPVNKTVWKVKQAPCWKCKYLFQSLSVGAACFIDFTTTDCMYMYFIIALVKIS